MGFLEEMREIYGEQTMLNLKIWANNNKKLANYENHKKFLLSCRKNQILPNHIIKTSKCIQHLLNEKNPFENRCQQILQNFQKQILNLEICYNHWKVKKIKNQLLSTKDLVFTTIPNNIFYSYNTSQLNYYNKQYIITKKRQKQKLSVLLEEQKYCANSIDVDSRWFLNLTNVNFPPNVQYLLSLGEKYNLPYSNKLFPLKQIIVDVEYIIDQIEDEDLKVETRNKAINVITNYINTQKGKNKTIINKTIFSDITSTHKFLKNHNDIIITKADKGNTTVVMYKCEYVDKALLLLNDSTTYKKLNVDPTIKVQNGTNKLVDELIKTKCIEPLTGKKLKCATGVFPKIYFLPKIHKDNVPLRPIVSCVGSSTYNLSKFLANLLTNAFVKDEYYVKNSFQFLQSITNIVLPEGYILVSLDVISLFTNVPIDLVVECIKENWDLLDNGSFTLDKVLQLFNFVVNNSYFNFENIFYQQISGLAMGNCLSPICSDIVMSKLQNTCINKLSFKVPFFCRYVDDIITAVPENKVDEILAIFNSFHHKLQFTIEIENDQKLPFLDTLVIRKDDNTIITDWYQKPTFSERFLNFYSQHPFAQKINIINNLKTRAMALSHTVFWEKNLLLIRSFLLKNNYPSSLVDKILKNNSQPLVTEPEQTLPPKKMYHKIPYVQYLSNSLSVILKEKNNFEIAKKAENTVKKNFFSTIKTKTPPMSKSGIIYEIPCNECHKTYIGQSGRYLKTRVKEHERDCINVINPLKKKNNLTALAEHCEKTGHLFNFNNVKVIGQQTNLKKRLLEEMINIKTHKNCLNKRSDIEGLNTSYYNLIDNIRQK